MKSASRDSGFGVRRWRKGTRIGAGAGSATPRSEARAERSPQGLRRSCRWEASTSHQGNSFDVHGLHRVGANECLRGKETTWNTRTPKWLTAAP